MGPPNADVMAKSLRLASISRLLSNDEEWSQVWKAIPNHFFDMYGGLNFLLRCNYDSRFLKQTGMPQFYQVIACVASVSVRFSARSRHFSFFSRAKIGASAKKCVTHFFALAPIFARLKNEKCLERAESLTETLATQANQVMLQCFHELKSSYETDLGQDLVLFNNKEILIDPKTFAINRGFRKGFPEFTTSLRITVLFSRIVNSPQNIT